MSSLYAWDLSTNGIVSPLWGSNSSELDYGISKVYTESDAYALVMSASPDAHIISDSLTGLDVPLIGRTHLFTYVSFAQDTVVTLTVAFFTSPAQILIDGIPVSVASCPFDTPPGYAVCVDHPCAQVSFSVGAGTRMMSVVSPSPRLLVAIALTEQTDVLAVTDGSWHVYNEAAAVPSPPPPVSQAIVSTALSALPRVLPPQQFYIVDPVSGLRLSAQGTLTVGGWLFSAPNTPSAVDWALGYLPISTSPGFAFDNTLSVVPITQAATFAFIPVVNGGWFICTRSACLSTNLQFVPRTSDSIKPWYISGAPMPGNVPLVSWFNGADPASISAAADGKVVSWRDTRDALIAFPRVARARSPPPSYSGITCPIRFSAGTSLAVPGDWDWSLPTSIVLAVRFVSPGTLLAQAGTIGFVSSGSSLSVSISDGVGNSVVSSASVPLRSSTPSFIALTRTTRTSWSIFINGALDTTSSLTLAYTGNTTGILGSESFGGCMLEALTFARALSEAEVATVTQYLQSKWTSLVLQPSPPSPPPVPLSNRTALSNFSQPECITGFGTVAAEMPAVQPGRYVIQFSVKSVDGI